MVARGDPKLASIIGYSIIKFRKKMLDAGRKAFTQQGCADKIGVLRQQWAAWELGKKLPSPANQRKIAELLEVSLSELRGEIAPPGLPVALEKGLEVASQLMAIQGEIAAVSRLLLEAGLEGGASVQSAMRDSLRRIRDQLGRVRDVVEPGRADDRASS
jgi:transcriptional regulator with XRE-family HTH domain